MHPGTILIYAISCLYAVAAGGLLVYALNCYVLTFLYLRQRPRSAAHRARVRQEYANLSDDDLPLVTTQIPMYNEYNVAARVLAAVCAFDYPAARHEIQLLDDSTDETREIIDRAVADLRSQGHDIMVVRRAHRDGFKAGALKNGLRTARGEFIAMFDADFIPQPDFLRQTIPFFLAQDNLGLVQARWAHCNRNHSLMTRLQAIGIDGHFMIEQGARDGNGLFMNFNGTAGVWRRDAVAAAGGWQGDTLTEDLDLSYRMQLAGWETIYLPDVSVAAEIPDSVRAFKSQQFRWAKGSIQTAIKLLPRIWRSHQPRRKKIQAVLHLTHYLVHPFILILVILSLPMLMIIPVAPAQGLWRALWWVFLLAVIAPNALYAVSQKALYRQWWQRCLLLPALSVVGLGLAFSNTCAVVEAICGVKSGFVRTPKRGDRGLKRYRQKLTPAIGIELLPAIYCTITLNFYLLEGKYIIGPFLAMYAAGFYFIGFLSIYQAVVVTEPKQLAVKL